MGFIDFTEMINFKELDEQLMERIGCNLYSYDVGDYSVEDGVLEVFDERKFMNSGGFFEYHPGGKFFLTIYYPLKSGRLVDCMLKVCME